MDETPRPGADEMWSAVSTRDAGSDGRFVYGVTSTGIYCRPSCGARLPKREGVRFFSSATEAEASGFRPCKRCHPEREGAPELDLKVAAAAAFIGEHSSEPITLARLARQVGVSPGHLQRVFTRTYGLSPARYQALVRGEAMKRGLREGDSVAEAGYRAGFGSSRAIYEEARRSMGMTPGAYRRGGKGLTIRYGIAQSPLGAVLVGTTELGVCCVLLGEDDAAVVHALAEEFPDAERRRDDAAVEADTREVVARVSGRGSHVAVPLDLRGTDFQRRVWAALQRVPAGSTVTYGKLAEEIGMPSAVRAVAGACAGNHVAVLVPCHRVIRSDGGLGGYRWGVERKRALLEREKPTPGEQ